jgi:hypothetical protein
MQLLAEDEKEPHAVKIGKDGRLTGAGVVIWDTYCLEQGGLQLNL